MLGAIAGDVIGSRWEHGGIRSTDFELLHPDCVVTDDSILTAATADVLLHGDDYEWNATCQGTVPEALVCALEAQSFEEAVRLAIFLGGDADTLAAIAGSVAEARFGGVPSPIAEEVVRRLPSDVAAILEEFRGRWQA